MARKHSSTLVKTPAVAGSSASLVEVKGILDISADDAKDDPIIRFMIGAAENFFEKETGRKLIEQSWYAYYPDWPADDYVPEGRPDMVDRLEIPFPPLKSITAIKYTDSAGQSNTVPANTYVVDAKSEPGGVLPAYQSSWPSTAILQVANAIEVEFVCGYGAKAADVPDDIRFAIAMMVEQWFHNRSTAEYAPYSGAQYIPPLARAVIDKYRIFNL